MDGKNNTQHSREAFDEAYAKLNAEQKKAVDTIEGPVMVIAGPGTGKTQILTLRIANILLRTDTKPENILALTFTDAGETAMRERLLRYIGTQAYRVPIYTFHAFAQHLIAEYPDAYTKIIGGRPASDLEKIMLIQTILDDGVIKHLRPLGDPSYYVKPILNIISKLKQEYIVPDTLALRIVRQEDTLLGIEKIHQKGAHKGKVRGEYQKEEKSIEKNKELLLVYRQYEALLRDKRLFDFDDMIVETVRALEGNEDMLRDLQEQYQYLLADEHQDVNGSQNKILELLASYHQRPNIFVVGDEKQAIYRFQGASLENFLYFENIFPATTSISLASNYRSAQRILDTAHSLISTNAGALSELRITLHAQKELFSIIQKRSFSHQVLEDMWVVTRVSALLAEGIFPQEIALIVRTNKEVEQYASLLRKEGIAVTATADSDILKHPITLALQSLIRAVVEVHTEEALFTVLHGAYWGIPVTDLFKIFSARTYGQSLLQIIEDENILAQLHVHEPEKILRVSRILKETRAMETTSAPQRVLEFLLQQSGFLDYVTVRDPLEGGKVIRRFYDEFEQIAVRDGAVSLRTIVEEFTQRERYGLPFTAPAIETHANAVQVMTAHKSKGLEFAVVIIPHMSDSSWGGVTRRNYFDIAFAEHIVKDDFDELDDERRLFYVALTRAKERLYISYAHTNQDGRLFVPSRLLEEISIDLIDEIETTMEESAFNPTSALLQSVVPVAINPELLQTFLQQRGISATALNNYLRSPYDYLYRNVLRMPEAQSESMQFGTVLHNVMEKVTAYHSHTGKMPSATNIKEYLERELRLMPFTQEEYVRLHERGFATILNYCEYIAQSLPQHTKEEFGIKVYLETGLPEFPQLLLTGKLDRLNFNAEGNVVQVIDYKSGKPKTRNEIEGHTQNGTGDYKRQLTFYALLLTLYGDERYVCKTGVLTFVEADSKGVIHEEVFVISDEEIALLTQELLRVTKEIISGSFFEQPCDEAVSSYCSLASLLQRVM